MSVYNVMAGTNALYTQYAGVFGPSGSNARAILPSSNSLNIGTGDYTVECWAQATSAIAAFRTICSTNTLGQVVLRFDGTQWNFSMAGLTVPTSTLPNPATNTWFHFSLCRSSGNVYAHVNGVQYASGTGNTTAINLTGANSRAMLGQYNNAPGQEWIGNISQFRVSNIARYTLNVSYTPSTILPSDSNVLLLLNSSTYVDSGPLNLGAFTANSNTFIRAVGIVR
jgi:hypothetical protein